MKTIISSVLFFVAASFGAFANNATLPTSNLTFEGLESKIANMIKVESVDDSNAICGFGGNVTDGDGVVIGHWYTSCIHKEPTIIIVLCEQ